MIMSKVEVALRSKAFWSLIGLFAVSGLEAIVPSLNGTTANIVQGILAITALYFHPTELKIAGSTGMLGSRRISGY